MYIALLPCLQYELVCFAINLATSIVLDGKIAICCYVFIVQCKPPLHRLQLTFCRLTQAQPFHSLSVNVLNGRWGWRRVWPVTKSASKEHDFSNHASRWFQNWLKASGPISHWGETLLTCTPTSFSLEALSPRRKAWLISDWLTCCELWNGKQFFALLTVENILGWFVGQPEKTWCLYSFSTLQTPQIKLAAVKTISQDFFNGPVHSPGWGLHSRRQPVKTHVHHLLVEYSKAHSLLRVAWNWMPTKSLSEAVEVSTCSMWCYTCRQASDQQNCKQFVPHSLQNWGIARKRQDWDYRCVHSPLASAVTLHEHRYPVVHVSSFIFLSSDISLLLIQPGVAACKTSFHGGTILSWTSMQPSIVKRLDAIVLWPYISCPCGGFTMIFVLKVHPSVASQMSGLRHGLTAVCHNCLGLEMNVCCSWQLVWHCCRSAVQKLQDSLADYMQVVSDPAAAQWVVSSARALHVFWN